MKKHFQLSIPDSCKEQWENFKPTPGGGFCERCSKEVIDFTSMGEEDIKAYFLNLRNSTCGKFRPGQLKKYEVQKPTSFATSPIAWIKAAVISLIVVLSSRETIAQNKIGKIKIENRMQSSREETKKITASSNIILVKGTVKSLEDNTAAPGVSVVQRGTTIGTGTDVNGDFSLTIDTAISDILEISFIGMKTAEHKVSSTEPIVVFMEADNFFLGEIVVGEIVVTHTISFRRWWWRLKKLF